jgi:glucose-1-phosphate adenylyltransferase
LLAAHDAPFNFYDPKLPIYTHEPVLPCTVVEDSTLTDVLLAEGCRIEKARISQSVVGIRSQIGAGTRIHASVINGRDYYSPDLGIGANCDIEGAILDKNATLGEGVVIRPFPRGTNADRDGWVIRDGIVVLPRIIFQPDHIGPGDRPNDNLCRYTPARLGMAACPHSKQDGSSSYHGRSAIGRCASAGKTTTGVVVVFFS